jgi:hypothetical protein
MKRKLFFGSIAIVLIAFALQTYFAFHPSRAFISHSPTNRWHAVDCTVSGFRDVSYHFRAHDFRSSPLKPILIGDLNWQGEYYSGDIFWSRDGSVAAASIHFHPDDRWAFACAYDFRERRAIRSTSSLLDDSTTRSMRRSAFYWSRGMAIIESRCQATKRYKPCRNPAGAACRPLGHPRKRAPFRPPEL